MGREDKAILRSAGKRKLSAAVAAMADRDGDSHITLPHVVLDSGGYLRASHLARGLLIDFISPLFRKSKGAGARGLPNGGLMCDREMLAKRGWKSVSTINSKVRELVDCGLLCITRQGGRRRPTLYAVTWLALATDDSYDLDIDPSKWKVAHRGAYNTPAKATAVQPAKPDRAAKAREARRLTAAKGRIESRGLSDSIARAQTGLPDSHQVAPTGLSDSLVRPLHRDLAGLSDSHSLEHCHLPRQRAAGRSVALASVEHLAPVD